MGPFLFLMYVNDLPTYTKTFPSLLYTDDCKCVGKINSISVSLLLLNDLRSKDWCLPFNLSKCKLLHITPSSSPAYFSSYFIDDAIIDSISHHRDLSVLFQTILHSLNIIASPAQKRITLYFLHCTMSSHHSVHTKYTLYVSIIRSRLSYCSQIWQPHLQKYMQISRESSM